MKSYWDYSEQERAKLTEEQVEKLLAYELMEKGVLQVEPLQIEEAQPVDLPTRRVFVLHEADEYGSTSRLPLAFDTIEQAEATRDAIRHIVQTAYRETDRTRPARAVRIVAEELPTQDDVTARKAVLDARNELVQRNEAARREHEKACKAVADATSGVWDDWRACRDAEARYQKIRDTLAEYVRMTDGNEDMALAFLVKVFSAEEIKAAVGAEISEAA